MKRTVISTTLFLTIICQMGLLHGQSETPNRDGKMVYDKDRDADMYTEQGIPYPYPPQSSSSSGYRGQRQVGYRTQASRQGSPRQMNPRRLSQHLSAPVQDSRQRQVRYDTAEYIHKPERRTSYRSAPMQPSMPRFSDLGIDMSPSQPSASARQITSSMYGSQAVPLPSSQYYRPSVRTSDRSTHVLPTSAWQIVSSQQGDIVLPESRGQYQSSQSSLPQYETYVGSQRPSSRHQGSVAASIPSPQYQVAAPRVRSVSRHRTDPITKATADRYQAGQYRVDTMRDPTRFQYRRQDTGALHQLDSQYHVDKATPRKVLTQYNPDIRVSPMDAASQQSTEPRQREISQLGQHKERATGYQHGPSPVKQTYKTFEASRIYQPSTATAQKVRKETVQMVPYRQSAQASPTKTVVKVHSGQKQMHVPQQPITEYIGHLPRSTGDNPRRHVDLRKSVSRASKSRVIPAPSLITLPQPSEFVVHNEVTRTKVPTKKSKTRQSSATKTMTSTQHGAYTVTDKDAPQTVQKLGLDQLRVEALLHNFNLTATGSVFLSPETRKQNEIALQNVVRRRPRSRGARRRRV